MTALTAPEQIIIEYAAAHDDAPAIELYFALGLTASPAIRDILVAAGAARALEYTMWLAPQLFATTTHRATEHLCRTLTA